VGEGVAEAVPVSMMLPPKVSQSTISAQSRGSVNVLVHQLDRLVGDNEADVRPRAPTRMFVIPPSCRDGSADGRSCSTRPLVSRTSSGRALLGLQR
jgi:hypothetical protein